MKKTRKWYDYIISYSFNKEGYLLQCNGMTSLSRVNKIDTFDEVRLVVDFLREHTEGAENIVISNIIYLGRNKHEV
jgi:hypothetical protein